MTAVTRLRKQGLTLLQALLVLALALAKLVTRASRKALQSCPSSSSPLVARKSEAGAEEAVCWAKGMPETSPGASQCSSQEIQAMMKRKAARRSAGPAGLALNKARVRRHTACKLRGARN